MLLIIALYFSMAATAISTIVLMYITPLDGEAAEDFIGIMAVYIGEPLTGVVYTLLFSLNAMILWVWGSFGEAAGLFATLVISYGIFHVTLVMRSLMRLRNPFIPQEERERRAMVVSRKSFPLIYPS